MSRNPIYGEGGAFGDGRGLKCPGCGSTRHHVFNTRDHMGGKRRTRRCLGCRGVFSTMEVCSDADGGLTPWPGYEGKIGGSAQLVGREKIKIRLEVSDAVDD